MKILNRLRDLWSSQNGIDPDGFGALIGAGDLDVDDLAFQSAMDSPSSSVGTLDGLRRRITGVHEEFPPGAVGQDDSDES